MLCINSLLPSFSNISFNSKFSFKVKTGEMLGILGPNGCGKTTLLRTIAGLYPNKSGDVTFNKESILKLSSQERANLLAIMVQHNSPCSGLTVQQVVKLGRAVGHSFNLELFEFIISSCRLTNIRDKPLERLSGGQIQRVMLAQALFQNTELLLLDELSNHLDIHHVHYFFQLIRDAKKTVIASFHDLNLAAKYCDKLLLMNKSGLISFGSPSEVLTRENIRNTFNVDSDVIKTEKGDLYIMIKNISIQEGVL
ncbi:ABC transporter ATP-binding protein [Vibrio harveyi]